jgi:hypothetical protein
VDKSARADRCSAFSDHRERLFEDILMHEPDEAVWLAFRLKPGRQPDSETEFRYILPAFGFFR